MKISHLITCLIILFAGAMVTWYSMQQGTTMRMLVRAHGGPESAPVQGLRANISELRMRSAEVSSAFRAAEDAQKNALMDMQEARSEYRDAEAGRDAAQEALNATIEEIKVAEAEQKRLIAQQNELLEFFSSIRGLESVDTFEDIVANLSNVIEAETERNRTLTARLEELVTVRTASMDKVATETMENDRMEEINNRFFQDYCKNEDEFAVQYVNTEWKVVVFYVGENSGLIAGDSNPMMVRRGNEAVVSLRIVSITADGKVVAEYRVEDLPPGVQIQVGDRVFRQKPVGN